MERNSLYQPVREAFDDFVPDEAATVALLAELKAKGVPFQAPPADYEWNAYCAYFTGPDDEVWEIYAWRPGGAPGKLET